LNYLDFVNMSESTLPPCPKCQSAFVYVDNAAYICPECGHEWATTNDQDAADAALVVRDAHGTVLNDGDSVTVIKDLKVKGASAALKVGTKVRSIRLVEGDHNIDCKIDGFGAMQLKSEFVKKA
jgi:protein PhnA